ncbi:MAG: hypothetical protein HPY61_03680 [Methanotrichaceae archaeon]|nr:hypothetical protein [Methanotrichaceae archaeon]
MKFGLAALHLLVLIFILIAPALSADASASFEQAGSNKEPFDVDGTIDYKIAINNDIGSIMRYEIELFVGPDKSDFSIYNKYTDYLNINARALGSATFPVNFRSPEMVRGDFGRWTGDDNETGIWDKAWYRVVITPLVGRQMTIEGYGGHPNLIKNFFEFKGASVSPTEGSSDDLYSYETSIIGSYEDEITLQTAPSAQGPWTDAGSRSYDSPGLLQTLRWENVTLDFDFSMAYYRFKGTKQSGIYEGPFWPVAMNARNSQVNPVRGLSSQRFDYSLEVNSSKKIDAVLNVLDVASKTFKPMGRASYKNSSQWQTMTWPGISPSEVSGSEGSSSYFFTFYYPGGETPFNRTEQFAGPDIVLVNFRNATVSPNNGSIFLPFNYSVELETALPRCDVELQTSDPGSTLWVSRGIVSYNGSQRTLYWNNTNLDGSSDGMARYRFLAGASASDEYQGPRIGTVSISATVLPYNGSLYITEPISEISGVYSYNYKAQVHDFRSDRPLTIGLEILDPVTNFWIGAGSQNYEPGQSWLNFSVNFARLSFQGPFLGTTKYRFTSEGRIINESSGPNIVVNFRNESLERLSDGNYKYRVEVRSSRSPLPVYIFYTNDGKNWHRSVNRQQYDGNGDWQELEWAKEPHYQKLEFIADIGGS